MKDCAYWRCENPAAMRITFMPFTKVRVSRHACWDHLVEMSTYPLRASKFVIVELL